MAAPGSGPLGRGLDISLAALRRHDPYIQGIVDVASQVALYTFSHKANEWEKTDVEGTLFVYTRSASPKHGFTIMNRLSMENRTEPITKDLEFQLQDPFLLYRNARFLIYGIWFYNKEECQKIAELMKNLTQQEQLKAQQSANVGVSPMNIHSDGKEVDILEMLSKAKNEYTKCKPCSEPKMMTSSSAIHTNPNLIKPIAVKPSDTAPQVTTVHQDKLADLEPQHLSLTTLFGKAEKNPVENADHKDSPSVRQTVVRSLSYEEPTWSADSCDKQLCPAIQKLMVRGTDLHPVTELPENQHCHNGAYIPPADVFSSLFLPLEDTTPLSVQDHVCGGDYLLQKLQGQHSIMPPLDRGPPAITQCISGTVMGSAPLNYYDPSQQNQRTSVTVAPASLPSQALLSTGAVSPQEFLKKLNLVHQEQQLQMNPKPALAAKFPVISQGAPKPPWTEKLPLGEKNNPLLQVISPQRIPATVSPLLLLSPAVFTQTCASDAQKTPHPAKEPASATANLLFPLSLQSTHSNQSSVLTKSQLQETLLHLIQNDENFLNTIYEAYISVLNRGGTSRHF